MKDALTAALGAAATVIFAEDIKTIAQLRLAVSHGGTEMVLLIVPADLPPLERAMVLAAVGPLALDLAPASRIAALDLADGAALADITAAGHFLAAARSTTGQVLRIGSPDA